MNRHIIFIIFLLSSTVLSAQNIQEDVISLNQDTATAVNDTIKKQTDGPVISFNITYHNIGNVPEGSNLTYDFEFFNTGNEPLLISNVRTSCNCTVASFPKTPVLPGKSEKITLELDTKMPGQFMKVVAVYSNAINDYSDSINKSRVILNIGWNVVMK